MISDEGILVANLNKATDAIGFHSLESDHWITETRRRGFGPVEEDDTGVLTLVDSEGVLRWVHHFSESSISEDVGGPRRGTAGIVTRQVIWEQKYEKLGENAVAKFLSTIDEKVTPITGLREWKNDQLIPLDTTAPQKPILLFIHGTFSNTENLIRGSAMSTFLGKAQSSFRILAFDHHTISTTPMLNALDLAEQLQDIRAPIHVICHSRGGLVARWWLEVFDKRSEPIGKCVLVGCPLNGTSLAAPDRIRHGLDLLSNFARVLGTASSAVPILTVVTGILKVLGSVSSVAAKTPAVDGLLSMIPGLASMSRIENNEELRRLRTRRPPAKVDYFAITSDFAPTDEPAWHFWKYFTQPVRFLDRAADAMVFRDAKGGDSLANDLVVDTASMMESSGLKGVTEENHLSFGRQDHVYHTGYFENEKTIGFLQKTFKIGESSPVNHTDV